MAILRFAGVVLAATLLVLLVSITPAQSQTSWVVPGTVGVDIRSMTMVGHYGLLSARYGVVVMDFSDPSSPVQVSQLNLPERWGNVEGQFEITVRYPYAFVPAWSIGFYVIDLSDWSNLQVVGQTALPSNCGRAVALYGDYAYVGGEKMQYGPGYVVDITTLSAPERLGSFTFLDGGLFDVHVQGSLLYAVSGHIYVVDLANPAEPIVIDTFPLANSCLSIAVQGHLLYATDAYIGSGLQGMGCFDISDPAEPVFLGKLSDSGAAITLAALNDHAWVGNYGVNAVNISDPFHPDWVVCYATGLQEPCHDVYSTYMPSGITIFDRFAFVTNRWQGLLAYELDAQGDATGDGVVTASDIIVVVDYVFKGGPPPVNAAEADASCTHGVTASDIILLVNYVFKGANVPVCP